MTDKINEYEKAQLAFQKLEVRAGDVVVVTFPVDIEPIQMEEFGLQLQPYIPEDVAILCTRQGVKVETLSEIQMNQMGWYKFDTNKVN